MNLFWLWLRVQDLLFLKEIYAQYIQDRSLFPPREISYNTSLVLPISPGCLQGLYYISHSPCPNLNYVDHNSSAVRRFCQNQYSIGPSQKNESEMTIVFWSTYKIDMQHLESAVWGTASSFLREVVRGSSGFKLQGLCEVVKNVPVHFSSCSLLTVH